MGIPINCCCCTFETLHFRLNFPHPTQTKVKFSTLGRSCLVKLPTPWTKKVVKYTRFARGGGGKDVEVSIWWAH